MEGLMALLLVIQCTPPKTAGVSAVFAGLSQGIVLMAGGAHFPDIPAAAGGTKVYERAITTPDGRQVGMLPVPMAYGASITTPQGILCAGGCNSQGPSRDAFLMQWDDAQQQVYFQDLPPLPVALDNTAGALCQGRCYVVGGNANGVPSNLMFSLDIAHPETGWQREPDFPGLPRIQVACAAQQKNGLPCLFVMGGFAPAFQDQPAHIALQTLCYEPHSGQWSALSTPVDGTTEIALGGGTAHSGGEDLIYCMGGVNKDVFLKALNNGYGPHYMKHRPRWYRFNDRILVYHVAKDTWSVHSRHRLNARAGAVLVQENDSTYWLLQGELMPGIRTDDNRKISIK